MGAAFLCINYRGKLLQHKLIRVQCTNKSTRVPVSPVPKYGYSVLKDYFERFFMVTTCSRSATRTTDCVLLSWAERNLGRYEHVRVRRARARARHYDSVLHSYLSSDLFLKIVSVSVRVEPVLMPFLPAPL